MKALLARWTIPVLVSLLVNAAIVAVAFGKVNAAFGWMMR